MFNGFVITTRMNREDFAFKEFVRKVIVPFSKTTGELETQLTNKDDFSEILKQELIKLKKSQKFVLQEKYKSILLVKNLTGQKPTEIFRWMRENELVFQNIARVIPLDLILSFDHQVIHSFISKEKRTGSYKIVFEGRLCPENTKENIFQIIVPLIDSKVDLENPDFLVVVQAFKSFIGLSVLDRDHKNFNFSISQIK